MELTMVIGSEASIRLRTPRLLLFVCQIEFVDALSQGSAVARERFDVHVPEDWPDQELASFLPLYEGQLREDPSLLGFGVWIMVEVKTQTVVGSAGFMGKPDADGVVEIGFGVHPTYRGMGYATEAVESLLLWALDFDEVRCVVAHCDPANAASIRVLEKVGLHRTEMEDARLAWSGP
jgi:[ribosomal protein S5]-alanine N-acetyltransferase